MKKYLVIALVLATVTMFALPVFAQLGNPADQANSYLEQVKTASGIQSSGDLPSLVGLIINVILSLLGIIFLVLMVYAGFLWMTAQGDPKPVETAKSIIKQAIIGLIITLAAYAISNFVITQIVSKI